MTKKYSLLLILGTLLVFTYINFQKYQPKVLRRIQEIKGITVKSDELPYPTGSVKVAETVSTNGQHITLKTPADYKKIKSFYENILLEKNWEVESEETNDTFYILKFKKKKNLITIISTLYTENGNTVVSIDVVSPVN